jgi:hypothetical protein
MGDWGAQSFQAVWFTQPAAADVIAVFAGIVGANPDNVHQQSVGIAIALGSNGVTQFRVQTQPGRIDYFETALGSATNAFPLASDIKKAFAGFAGRIAGGIQPVGNANRLAIVVSISKQIDKASEASSILGEMLNSKMPFDDVENLGFQINKRRAVGHRDDIEMNRLMTMQLQNIQQFDMINPASPVLKNIETVMISVDCNTHSRQNLTLQPSEQVPIWKELAVEAERLCDARSAKALS